MKHALPLFCLILAVACATTDSRRYQRIDELQAAEAYLADNERALDGTLGATATPVDCARAIALSDNICALAERICALVARMPEDPSGPARCTDARRRCQTGRARMSAACKKEYDGGAGQRSGRG